MGLFLSASQPNKNIVFHLKLNRCGVESSIGGDNAMTIYCLGVVLQEVKRSDISLVTFRLWRCFCFEKAWRLEGVVATSGWVVDEDLADQ